jgi:hypothetical protein
MSRSNQIVRLSLSMWEHKCSGANCIFRECACTVILHGGWQALDAWCLQGDVSRTPTRGAHC